MNEVNYVSYKNNKDIREYFDTGDLVKICAPMVRYSNNITGVRLNLVSLKEFATSEFSFLTNASSVLLITCGILDDEEKKFIFNVDNSNMTVLLKRSFPLSIRLQFRNLVKKYNCDIFFTPMILADSFHKSKKARNNEFTTNLDDIPVIIQFAANTIDDFVTAASLASPFCSGVDLNCGCPQRWARQQGLGCVMLENPQKIFDITRECRNKINKPFSVSVKMRILNDFRKTVEICRQIEKSGATFLTIHARTPEKSTGDINKELLKLIKDNISIPLVANGGVKTLTDCYELKESTRCDGVMVANGILQNPTIFSGRIETPYECVQHWVDICFNTSISPENFKLFSNAKSQLTISERPTNLTFQCFHHHLVFMLEKILPKKKRRIFNNFKRFHEVLEFLKEEMNIVPNLYNVDSFRNITPLCLDYDDLVAIDDDSVGSNYNSSNTNGKYFSKILDCNEKHNDGTDCDWSNMFLEND